MKDCNEGLPSEFTSTRHCKPVLTVEGSPFLYADELQKR
jgi:hypothetical protein